MTEPFVTPTQEVYANEVKYMTAWSEHSKAFDIMLDSVPPEREDIKNVLIGLYTHDPKKRLIDREKLTKLKDQNESLYTDVNSFLSKFLERKANLVNQEKHIEWLKKVAGTRVEQVQGAKPMVGIDGISLDTLVVSDIEINWEVVKQHIIPLEVEKSGNESSSSTIRRLKMLRAQLNSDDAFLVLVEDQQMGGENNWALSVINPRDLELDEEKIKNDMGVSYMTGQLALGSSSRAALLAVSGKKSL